MRSIALALLATALGWTAARPLAAQAPANPADPVSPPGSGPGSESQLKPPQSPDPGTDAVLAKSQARFETTVTALRLPRPLPDVPATVTVLPRAELERVPGLGMDELVRLSP